MMSSDWYALGYGAIVQAWKEEFRPEQTASEVFSFFLPRQFVSPVVVAIFLDYFILAPTHVGNLDWISIHCTLYHTTVYSVTANMVYSWHARSALRSMVM